jgi:predicted mannosyl-3-phosphoglycerate phosphatase (HAD superfamily)
LIPARGKSVAGLDEFTAALDHEGIPAVWLTNRTRLEFDAPRRKLAHTHPFIAEGGCGVFLPTGYFHTNTEQTIRLGRFLCVAVAKEQPAAAEALEDLSEQTGVEVVALRLLSPRELAQNTGLPQREAELVRQRDFDELFFFAGASEKDIQRFVAAGRGKKYELRQHGVMWSLAIGASVKRCVLVLAKLYDRALRYHPTILGVATEEDGAQLFPACDRTVVLDEKSRGVGARGGLNEDGASATSSAGADEGELDVSQRHEAAPRGERVKHFSLRDPELWPQLLEIVAPEEKDSYK